jgi:hypothetical protein
VPYRMYVDSGVVLLCIFGLAPVAPLVAPAAMFYFLVCQPLLRRNVIFMYRPSFDGGGLRWPFLFDMIVSALVVSEVLLAVQLGLKAALGPAVLAGLTIAPTLHYSFDLKKRYKRAFNDAALLQTSLLDGWDTSEPSSSSKREEFRRFLVDAHKAAYVPVCLAATDTENFLTSEPAVVVPVETDTDFEDESDILLRPHDPSSAVDNRPRSLTLSKMEDLMPDAPDREVSFGDRTSSGGGVEQRLSTQYGATLRRASTVMAALRQRKMSATSDYTCVPQGEPRPSVSPLFTHWSDGRESISDGFTRQRDSRSIGSPGSETS